MSVEKLTEIGDKVRALLREDPKSALAILGTVEAAIGTFDAPIATPMLDDDGDPVIRVEGRWDYSLDCFYVVDVSQRWTYPGSDRFDLEKQTVSPNYDGDSNYETLAYFLDDGLNPLLVSLPDSWEEI